MLINSESQCSQFVANDGCKIRELLHPKNDPIELAFSLAIAEIEPGGSTHPHRLAQAEVYYVIAGVGVIHIGEEAQTVCVGDAVFIPPNDIQWLHNTGLDALKFVAIVTPPWRGEDDERVD